MAIFNGKIHYKWPFSIAMLVYQRVYPLNIIEPERTSWISAWIVPSMSLHVWLAHLQSLRGQRCLEEAPDATPLVIGVQKPWVREHLQISSKHNQIHVGSATWHMDSPMFTQIAPKWFWMKTEDVKRTPKPRMPSHSERSTQGDSGPFGAFHGFWTRFQMGCIFDDHVHVQGRRLCNIITDGTGGTCCCTQMVRLIRLQVVKSGQWHGIDDYFCIFLCNVGRTIINHPPVITINRWHVYQCLPFSAGWFIIVLSTLFFLEGGGAAKLCDNQLLDNSDTKPSQCHTRSSRCPRTLELKLPIPVISSRCCPRSGCAWAVGFTCSRLMLML